MLAHEARSAVVIDNELQRFVEPPILAITMPVLMSTLFEGHRRRIIQADNERRRFYGFERGFIEWAGGKETVTGLIAV
jgi:hypothetical protein